MTFRMGADIGHGTFNMPSESELMSGISRIAYLTDAFGWEEEKRNKKEYCLAMKKKKR